MNDATEAAKILNAKSADVRGKRAYAHASEIYENVLRKYIAFGNKDTMRALAAKLEKEGVLAPRGGLKWNPSQVRRILLRMENGK